MVAQSTRQKQECPHLSGVQARLDAHDQRLAGVDKAQDEIWEVVNEIRDRLLNRLPAWATITIGILTAVLGALIGAIARTALKGD